MQESDLIYDAAGGWICYEGCRKAYEKPTASTAYIYSRAGMTFLITVSVYGGGLDVEVESETDARSGTTEVCSAARAVEQFPAGACNAYPGYGAYVSGQGLSIKGSIRMKDDTDMDENRIYDLIRALVSTVRTLALAYRAIKEECHGK